MSEPNLIELTPRIRQGLKSDELVIGSDDLLRKGFVIEDAQKLGGEGSRTFDFTISTSSVDRDFDTVSVEGWELDAFRSNPVVLFAHDYRQPPVGRAKNTRVEGDRLRSEMEFTPEGWSDLNDLLFRMYDQKFMRATSVGFRPKEWKFAEDEGRAFGIDFLKQELLEFSLVPVPANPEALLSAHSKGLDTSPLREWISERLDDPSRLKGIGVNDLEAAWKAVRSDRCSVVVSTPLLDDEEKEESTESDNKVSVWHFSLDNPEPAQKLAALLAGAVEGEQVQEAWSDVTRAMPEVAVRYELSDGILVAIDEVEKTIREIEESIASLEGKELSTKHASRLGDIRKRLATHLVERALDWAKAQDTESKEPKSDSEFFVLEAGEGTE